MSPQTGARPRPSRPLAAIVGYTIRACLPARRVLLLLPLMGAVLFGLLSLSVEEPAVTAFARVGGNATHSLILPITCLIVGDAILGAEVRTGVFAFTWLSPVPFALIVVGRWIGGLVIATLMLAPAVALGAMVAGAPGSAAPAALAVVAGSGAYLALFVAIGVMFRRPIVWSLALVIIVERLLGAVLAGVAQLSPGWLAQAVLVDLTDASVTLSRRGLPTGWAAVGRLTIVAAVGLALATRRLAKLRPGTAAD